MLARACRDDTGVRAQMFIGDGAKLVRDAFALAKEKTKSGGKGGAIIFIDEVGGADMRGPRLRAASLARAQVSRHARRLSLAAPPFCLFQLDAIGTKRFGGEQSGDREVLMARGRCRASRGKSITRRALCHVRAGATHDAGTPQPARRLLFE